MGYAGGSEDGVDLRVNALTLCNRFDDIGESDVMPTAFRALLADPVGLAYLAGRYIRFHRR
jgi:hypothetical protein